MPLARVKIYVPIAIATANRSATDFMEGVLQEMRTMAASIVSEGEYATGRMAASLELQGPLIRGETVRGAVGSRLDEALVVHDGAKIHEIFPKNAVHIYRFGSHRRPQLKFFWRRKGRVAFFPHIPGGANTVGHSHPGMKGKKYLEIPLQIVGRRHGFKVTTRDL